MDNEGRIRECAKDRIHAGNRTCTASYYMLISKIMKAVKFQIYRILIRPVATYGAVTWNRTKSDKNFFEDF
jgi:hypothetical protein